MDVTPATPAGRGLFFGLLGPLAAWRDGEPLELATPQQRRVLAALILRRNQVVSVDALVDGLWPAGPPVNAVQTVRTYLSRLRRSLDGTELDASASALVSHASGYALELAHGELDVDLFESLASGGRAALDDGDAAGAASELREALALVRGPPLAGMEYDDFCRHEVERLEELRLLAREDLADARLALGEHVELIAELQAAVVEYPLRERFCAQLMLALYRAGRQAEALACYRQTRDLLGEELGLEPSRTLRELERLILLQERTLDHHEVGRAHGVPSYPTSFLGRHGELEAIRVRLVREHLVTLVGPAGTGKTRLAAKAAAQLRSRYPDGIWWIDLAPVDVETVPEAFARMLAIRDVPGQETEDLVVARLRGTRTLLIVDNCEHVVLPVAILLRRVLVETGAHVLATSREPLRIDAEAVQQVPPLAVPTEETVDAGSLLEYDAVQLFLARSGDLLDPDRLGRREAAAITRVVESLDGLPLAIELAAGKLRSLSLDELAERLETRLGLLDDGRRTAPERHQTLEAAIEWSYTLLTDHERRTLISLAVFPGSFDAKAAEAVAASRPEEADSTLGVVTRLVDKSLVHFEPGDSPRYRLLQTVRVFVRNREAGTNDFAAAAGRHRDHYTRFAEDLYRGLLEPGQVGAWLDRGYIDEHNLRTALVCSLDGEDGEAALQLASALTPYWFRTSQLQEGLRFFEHALELAPADSRWRPRALMGQGYLQILAGVPEAEETVLGAVAACREADPELLALALTALAQIHMQQGDYDQAEETIADARRIFAELEHAEGLHFTDELMGVARFLRGDLDSALAYLLRSRDGYFEMRGNAQAGWTHIHLARVQFSLGHFDEAESSAQTAVEEFHARHDPRGLAAAYTCLGQTNAARGDPDRARLLLDEAITLARRWNYPLETKDAQAALHSLPTSD